jgi:hypothetical protein
MNVLQIASTGKDSETVNIGIKNFPVHKLALICLQDEKEAVENYKHRFQEFMKIDVDIYTLQTNLIDEMLNTVSLILEKERKNFDDIIVNVAGGSKHLTCAATVAAFVHGLKAFHIMGGNVVMLPILKLSYQEILSKAKIEILRALSLAGGEIDSLTRLSEVSGYSKSLLSYHILGSENVRGLASLGLVEVERHKRGRLRVNLSSLGSIALQNIKT